MTVLGGHRFDSDSNGTACYELVLTIGIELTRPGPWSWMTVLGGHRFDSDANGTACYKLVLTIGIEPMTSSLPRKCSTD